MRIKLLTIFLSLLFPLQMAFASTTTFPLFYAGITLGGKAVQTNIDTKTKSSFSGLHIKSSIGAHGLAYGVEAGVSKLFSNLYLGATANFQHMNIQGAESTSSATSDQKRSIKQTEQLNFLFLPGWRVTSSTVLFGIVGYSRGKFREEEYSTSLPADSTSKTDALDGASFGLGLLVKLSQHFLLKTTATYTHFESFENSFRPFIGALDNDTYRPESFAADISIDYGFGV